MLAAWTPTRSKPGLDASQQRIVFQPLIQQSVKPLQMLVDAVPEVPQSRELLDLLWPHAHGAVCAEIVKCGSSIAIWQRC